MSWASLHWGELHPSAYPHLAAAALAAADKAATITTEWGTGLGDEVMIWKDRAQAERQSAGATATYDQGKTWVHTNPPVAFRTLTEWKEATHATDLYRGTE